METIHAESSMLCLRPPLKKMLFPVWRPGEYIRADWDIFLFSFFHIFFSYHYFYYFLTKRKKKFAAAQLTTILATRWIGNKLFF